MNKKFKRKGIYLVYMVECSDGTYYTGYTSNLERRIAEHGNKRGARYLRGKGPVKLVYAKEYRYYKIAVQKERAIKTLTRKEKERLVKSSSCHAEFCCIGSKNLSSLRLTER